jgi:hypothetical protein
MFSLFQILTLSGWSQSIVRKFFEQGDTWFTVLMIFYVLFSVLIVLNLLTAVIIEGAFSDLQYEETQKKLRAQNKQAKTLDEISVFLNDAVPPTSDTPDYISKSEFDKISKNKLFTAKVASFGIEAEELDHIFAEMDEYGKGVVNIEELCAGFAKLKNPLNAKDIFSCVAHLRALTNSLENVSDAQGLRGLQEPLVRLEQEIIPQLSQDIDEILKNIDDTIVAVQHDSIKQINDSVKASFPRPPVPN